ncbi:arf-GAP with coiled-coil, ANK repeat and PH domain-containing protein 1 [Rhinatrema bivittatum]|uniref:arf-GAP with coiled-coil, ANK repeat and PH domain-containing protein 1 n=1 Tax=Rhinatrema bivittatum TaxID=194408 RepID=UPI00112C0EC0|nr:arf-GAP with coiled-coil, ANK repeat and PH domain-containing protein 1 [Rhinatrema bivittatum]
MTVDFEECLKDSPRFRSVIDDVECDVSELESRLEKLVKLCTGMLETGRQYCSHSKSFISGIRDLSQHSKGDSMMSDCLLRFSETLNKMIDSHLDLLETTQLAFKQQLQTFVKEDIKKFKETKKEFDRCSESLDSALHHNAEVPRKKQHEAEEASNALTTARKAFCDKALDYVLQINVIQSKKKFEIMKFMLAYMEAHFSHYQQGHSTLQDLETYHRTVAGQLHQLVLESAREKRDMEQRHIIIKQKDLAHNDSLVEFKADAPSGIVMEGYLYKRASNAFKTWSRRWFSIQNNQLVYQKKLKDTLTVVVEDLRLCTVKPCLDHERRFCFEVVSPSKSCMLQADSDKYQQTWISAVQSSIATAFNESHEDPTAQRLERATSVSAATLDPSRLPRDSVDKKVLEQVQRLPGNAQCCDCKEPAPEWASINLGITLCIECSGIHRSLGVHFSKVRSLTLDSWEPELIKLMCELGNATINRIYEARIEEMTIKKPSPSCTRSEKEAWIRAKYVQKKFINKLPEMGIRFCCRSRGNTLERLPGRPEKSSKPPLKPKPGTLVRSPGVSRGISVSSPTALSSGRVAADIEGTGVGEDLRNLHPGALLYRAAACQSLPTMADALAHGADANWVNNGDENRTPLIQAVLMNSLVACEFLLQNGASVNQADSCGRGPLHHATILGHTGLACLFLKRGATMSAVDAEGKDPLSIAIENANADIVTLLRLAKMREAEVALGQSGDETYLDIFRDFSLMASDNPEKLNRRSYDLKLTTL